MAGYIDEAKCTKWWAAELTDRGIPISERTLREMANVFRKGRRFGRALLLTASDIEAMMIPLDRRGAA